MSRRPGSASPVAMAQPRMSRNLLESLLSMSRQLIRSGLELLESPSPRDKNNSLVHKKDERKASKRLRTRRQSSRRQPAGSRSGHFGYQTIDESRRKKRKQSTIGNLLNNVVDN
jgi:hypothetical protein